MAGGYSPRNSRSAARGFSPTRPSASGANSQRSPQAPRVMPPPPAAPMPRDIRPPVGDGRVGTGYGQANPSGPTRQMPGMAGGGRTGTGYRDANPIGGGPQGPGGPDVRPPHLGGATTPPPPPPPPPPLPPSISGPLPGESTYWSSGGQNGMSAWEIQRNLEQRWEQEHGSGRPNPQGTVNSLAELTPQQLEEMRRRQQAMGIGQPQQFQYQPGGGFQMPQPSQWRSGGTNYGRAPAVFQPNSPGQMQFSGQGQYRPPAPFAGNYSSPPPQQGGGYSQPFRPFIGNTVDPRWAGR